MSDGESGGPQEERPTVPAPPEITARAVQKWFTVTASVASAVLLALMIQKSDGKTVAQMLGLLGLAAVAVLLLSWLLFALVTRRRVHAYRFGAIARSTPTLVLAAVVGSASAFVSFKGVDREPSDFTQEREAGSKSSVRVSPPGDGVLHSPWRGEGGLFGSGLDPWGDGALLSEPIQNSDSGTVALRNLVVGESGGAQKIVVTIVNKTEAALLLDAVRISVTSPGLSTSYCSGADEEFTLEDDLVVTDAGSIEKGAVRGQAGVLEGVRLPIRGELGYDSCGGFEHFDIASRASINIDPLGTSTLAFTLPNEINVRTLSKFHGEPRAPTAPTSAPVELRPASAGGVLVYAVAVAYGTSDVRAGIVEELPVR